MQKLTVFIRVHEHSGREKKISDFWWPFMRVTRVTHWKIHSWLVCIVAKKIGLPWVASIRRACQMATVVVSYHFFVIQIMLLFQFRKLNFQEFRPIWTENTDSQFHVFEWSFVACPPINNSRRWFGVIHNCLDAATKIHRKRMSQSC